MCGLPFTLTRSGEQSLEPREIDRSLRLIAVIMPRGKGMVTRRLQLSRIGYVVASAFHGFDFAPTNALARSFTAARMAATRKFLTQG
jgi:hypothetical protein